MRLNPTRGSSSNFFRLYGGTSCTTSDNSCNWGHETSGYRNRPYFHSRHPLVFTHCHRSLPSSNSHAPLVNHDRSLGPWKTQPDPPDVNRPRVSSLELIVCSMWDVSSSPPTPSTVLCPLLTPEKLPLSKSLHPDPFCLLWNQEISYLPFLQTGVSP